MPVNSLADAQNHADARRDRPLPAAYTAQAAANYTALSGSAIINALRQNDAYSTVSIGLYYQPGTALRVLLVASQDGAFRFSNADVAALAGSLGLADLLYLEDGARGHHAEMMIAAYVHGKIASKNYGSVGLAIFCPGKMVCGDCAGYLNKNGVPHSESDGKPSRAGGGLWWNPTSHSFYKGGKTIRGYGKGANAFGEPVL